MIAKKKILNDPVYGFVNIPGGIIFDLIEHKYFQRLRRIKQLGLSYLVYPGAVHTRFHHAIGAMHLISLAIDVIRSKGHEITPDEAEAAQIAILLHDIGHAPMSHALENCIVQNVSHEQISLCFMHELNVEFNGQLDLAIKIFENKYHKKYLHQLISGQLDMDRLDYLRRDSFFTGVTEGVVGSERIIKMLQVVDDNLVVETKGIYSVEKFLIARRLMYWQVYLHKTVLVAEILLTKIFERVRELFLDSKIDLNNKNLEFFMSRKDSINQKELTEHFYMLDDIDIMSIIKQATYSNDLVLKNLSDSILNRKLPKIYLTKDKLPFDTLEQLREKTKRELQIPDELVGYFLYSGEISNNTYNNNDERINILQGEKLTDIAEASDMLNLSVLNKNVKKYYICGHKNVINPIKK